MKNVNISVEYTDPEKALKDSLSRKGARNINIRRTYDGSLEVRYEIKCSNPQKDIAQLIEKAGGNNVRPSTSYNGARFEFKIDDRIDERVFKKQIIDVLRKAGFRAN